MDNSKVLKSSGRGDFLHLDNTGSVFRLPDMIILLKILIRMLLISMLIS